jgi:hypothetical protein
MSTKQRVYALRLHCRETLGVIARKEILETATAGVNSVGQRV